MSLFHAGLAVDAESISADALPQTPQVARASERSFVGRSHKDRKDPQLVFILARQSLLRWEFAAATMAPHPDRATTEEAKLLTEIELGLEQLRSVHRQILPLARSHALAIRFEAEEVMARVEALAEKMERQQRQCVDAAQRPDRTTRAVRNRLLAMFSPPRRASQPSRPPE